MLPGLLYILAVLWIFSAAHFSAKIIFFQEIPRRLVSGGGQSLGSGFIVDSSGYIVTNQHVSADALTIVVTTHQVEEVQHILTDVMFVNRGRIVLDCSMEEFDSRYLEVMVHAEHVAAARALKPMHERQVFGRSILLFDHADRDRLAAFGEVRTPSIADLFVAVMGNKNDPQGAAS